MKKKNMNMKHSLPYGFLVHDMLQLQYEEVCIKKKACTLLSKWDEK